MRSESGHHPGQPDGGGNGMEMLTQVRSPADLRMLDEGQEATVAPSVE